MSVPSSEHNTGLQTYRRLLRYITPYWSIFLISIGGYLLYAAAQPMFAGLIGKLIDAIQVRDETTLKWIPIALVGIVVVRGFGAFLGSYYLAKVGNNIIHTLRCQIFDQYTALPSAYFDRTHSGHLISRVTYNVTQVTAATTDAIKVIIREGLTIIGLLSYLIYTNWQLSLTFLIVAPIIGWLVSLASKRFRKLSIKIQDSMGDLTHIASELINGYRVVRSFGGEAYEKKRFYAASRDNYRQSLKMVQTTAIHTPILQLIISIALAMMIYLAIFFMTDASTGDFIAYLTAAAMIPKPIRQVSRVNSIIQRGIAAAESIFEILDTEREIDHGNHSVARVSGKLEFKNVSFNYPDSENRVLNAISFTAQPGQTIALVGHSGSGKSTLAHLIPRFHDHSEGQILLDDIEITEYTLKNLRQQIALVTQHITLFNDTIEKNIAYGSLSDKPLKQVIAAADAANATGFINQFSEGFSTEAGENGVKLSGGQKQRLAIARALLKDAPVLILDEATSALDSESEWLIQQALSQVMKDRTTLVIAHRLSTIEKADQILVLKDGHIVESGTHQTLINKKGVYAQLHKHQFQN